MIDIPDTVKDILLWKNGSNINADKNSVNWPISIEALHDKYVSKCNGKDMTDVLYSFLGIYAIGVWVFNKDKDGLFQIDNNKIRTYRSESRENYDQVLCSKRFLLELQDRTVNGIEVSDLNNTLEDYTKVYFSVGNLFSMWPGGNVYRGNQNIGLMDIPELFFNRYKNSFWLSKLLEHPQAALKDVAEEANLERYNSLKNFLKSVNDRKKYVAYIKKASEIIISRTKFFNSTGIK